MSTPPCLCRRQSQVKKHSREHPHPRCCVLTATRGRVPATRLYRPKNLTFTHPYSSRQPRVLPIPSTLPRAGLSDQCSHSGAWAPGQGAKVCGPPGSTPVPEGGQHQTQVRNSESKLFQTLKTEFPRDPAILLLGIDTKELKAAS